MLGKITTVGTKEMLEYIYIRSDTIAGEIETEFGHRVGVCGLRCLGIVAV